MEYISLDPLIGPKGVQLTPAQHPTLQGYPTGLIPKTSKNPEIAFRLIDAFYTSDFHTVINYGEEGKGWKKAEPGELADSGKPATISVMSLDKNDQYFNNYRLPGFPSIPESPVLGSAPQDPKAPKGAGHSIVLYKATERMEPYKVPEKNILPNFYYLPEENEKIGVYKATINPYIQESIARFITGDMNLDKDWDKHLKELENLGLSKYISIVQGGYDRWKSSLK